MHTFKIHSDNYFLASGQVTPSSASQPYIIQQVSWTTVMSYQLYIICCFISIHIFRTVVLLLYFTQHYTIVQYTNTKYNDPPPPLPRENKARNKVDVKWQLPRWKLSRNTKRTYYRDISSFIVCAVSSFSFFHLLVAGFDIWNAQQHRFEGKKRWAHWGPHSTQTIIVEGV